VKVGIFGHDWALRDNARGCRRVGFFPVLVNLALSGLDEHIAQMPGGPDSSQASESPAHMGLGNYRVVRYADGWLLLVIQASAGERRNGI
jgi:RNA-directed DNA polymerase